MTSTSATAWNQQEPFRTALDALERLQWSVFPLDEDKRPPKTGGTHPDRTPKRLAWKHLQTRRPSPQEVLFWQKTYNPSAWAVITGSISGLVGLDFDGEAGRQLCQQLGLKPHVQTGSGGCHNYAQHPGWSVPTLNGKSKQILGERWPGLDIRGDGGYAAFCGRNSNGSYTWLRDPVPDDLSGLPEDLRAMLRLLHPPGPARQAYELLLRALEQSKRGRNDAGFWLACQLRDNNYGQDEATDLMIKYASRVASVNSKGQYEPYSSEEALSSLASAYQREPRVAWDVSASAASRPGDSDLPIIYIGDRQLSETVDQAVKAIEKHDGDTPKHFIRAGRLVSIGQDKSERTIINQMDSIHVREVLTHSAQFFRRTHLSKDQKDQLEQGLFIGKPTSPPKELAEQILARQTQPPYLPFSELTGLVEIPILRPDGSICDQPGYDPQTCLYYALPPKSEPCSIPSNPTSQDVEEALELIWDTFGEFPYASQADRANTLGLLMTPLIHPIIQRHIPIGLLDAPKKGAGKSMIVNLMSIIATGRPASLMVVPSSEDEWEKRITTVLMKGQTIVCLDNVRGLLQSSAIDLLLTSERFTGRILGQSYMPELTNRSIWTATGNNLKVGGDLARRAYWIRLDPKVSEPWTRTGFRHQDIIGWVTQQRVALIRAIFILVRAWYAAGAPLATDIPVMGTFSHWVSTIGSILAYVGVEGFLSNQNQFYEEADETSAQWETFLQAWHDTFGSNWVKISNMVGLLNEQAANSNSQDQTTVDLVEALPERLQILLNEKPKSFNALLGRDLKKHADECFGKNNLHLEQGKKDRTKALLWRVLPGSAEDADNADNVSVNSQKTFSSVSQKSADDADDADNISVSSQKTFSSASQKSADDADNADNVSVNSQKTFSSVSQKSADDADDADNISVSSQKTFSSASQKSADDADDADNISVSSQKKNSPVSQIVIEKNQSENGGNNYPHHPHIQRGEMPQTSLGSGLMPIENGAKVSIESSASSALSQPAIPLSLSNDQKDERIASYNGPLNQASSTEGHTPDTERNDRPSPSNLDASIVKKVKRIRI